MKPDIQKLRDKVLDGGQLTDAEVMSLADDSVDSDSLREAAATVTSRFVKPVFESCSIINVRSGRCPENCKWCAQSAHYATGCETYPMASVDDCVTHARVNHQAGVRRFSLVASGKRVSGAALDDIIERIGAIKERVGIETCASLGLLDQPALQRLYDAGVRRYHCNLETAPSHFATLCSTHTIDDKLATIAAAHAVGMEVCSGGIIGMGETHRQRAEFAVTLRRARPVSIPINILCPIPGTPLADTQLISEDDIIDAVAIMRLAHPRTELRFAGGRQRLSRAAQLEAMRVGINGGIVGDLLTTVGSTTCQDQQLAKDAGYEF